MKKHCLLYTFITTLSKKIAYDTASSWFCVDSIMPWWLILAACTVYRCDYPFSTSLKKAWSSGVLPSRKSPSVSNEAKLSNLFLLVSSLVMQTNSKYARVAHGSYKGPRLECVPMMWVESYTVDAESIFPKGDLDGIGGWCISSLGRATNMQ